MYHRTPNPYPREIQAPRQSLILIMANENALLDENLDVSAMLPSSLGGTRARHVWLSHKMQRTFLNWRKSVDLVSAWAPNNQARLYNHQSKLIPSHQVRNTFCFLVLPNF